MSARRAKVVCLCLLAACFLLVDGVPVQQASAVSVSTMMADIFKAIRQGTASYRRSSNALTPAVAYADADADADATRHVVEWHRRDEVMKLTESADQALVVRFYVLPYVADFIDRILHAGVEYREFGYQEYVEDPSWSFKYHIRPLPFHAAQRACWTEGARLYRADKHSIELDTRMAVFYPTLHPWFGDEKSSRDGTSYCSYLTYVEGVAVKWDKCNRPHPYVCEKRAEGDVWTATPTTEEPLSPWPAPPCLNPPECLDPPPRPPPGLEAPCFAPPCPDFPGRPERPSPERPEDSSNPQRPDLEDPTPQRPDSEDPEPQRPDPDDPTPQDSEGPEYQRPDAEDSEDPEPQIEDAEDSEPPKPDPEDQSPDPEDQNDPLIPDLVILKGPQRPTEMSARPAELASTPSLPQAMVEPTPSLPVLLLHIETTELSSKPQSESTTAPPIVVIITSVDTTTVPATVIIVTPAAVSTTVAPTPTIVTSVGTSTVPPSVVLVGSTAVTSEVTVKPVTTPAPEFDDHDEITEEMRDFGAMLTAVQKLLSIVNSPSSTGIRTTMAQRQRPIILMRKIIAVASRNDTVLARLRELPVEQRRELRTALRTHTAHIDAWNADRDLLNRYVDKVSGKQQLIIPELSLLLARLAPLKSKAEAPAPLKSKAEAPAKTKTEVPAAVKRKSGTTVRSKNATSVRRTSSKRRGTTVAKVTPLKVKV